MCDLSIVRLGKHRADLRHGAGDHGRRFHSAGQGRSPGRRAGWQQGQNLPGADGLEQGGPALFSLCFSILEPFKAAKRVKNNEQEGEREKQ